MYDRNSSKRDLYILIIWILAVAPHLVSPIVASAIGSDDDPKMAQHAQHSAETLYLEGLEYRQRGEYEAAAKKFSEAIYRGWKTARAYFYRGEAFLQLKHYEEALTNLSEAIRLDPEDVHALGLRAFTHVQRGELDAALVDFSRGLTIKPNPLTAKLYEARGRTYWTMDRHAEAIEDYTNVVEQDPSNPRGYVVRGRAFAQDGKFLDAIRDFSVALDGDGVLKRPLLDRG